MKCLLCDKRQQVHVAKNHLLITALCASYDKGFVLSIPLFVENTIGLVFDCNKAVCAQFISLNSLLY